MFHRNVFMMCTVSTACNLAKTRVNKLEYQTNAICVKTVTGALNELCVHSLFVLVTL